MKKITVLTSLYNCSKYLKGYFECIRRLQDVSDVEILLLHNAPQEEEISIISEYIPLFPFIKHIIIPEREGLYETWNRGVLLASGEYITIWNVDDIRFPDSLQAEAKALDENPDADMAYGDYYYMYKYGEISDKLEVNKEFDKSPSAFFSTHQIGCFPMWRKGIHEKVGYFDEQFKLVADFDFQVRAARNCRLVKTPKPLGAYLDDCPDKLSSNTSLQRKEGNILALRYGRLDYFDMCYVLPLFKYRCYEIESLGNVIPVSNYFRGRKAFVFKRIPLFFLSLLRQPRYILAFIKHDVLGY